MSRLEDAIERGYDPADDTILHTTLPITPGIRAAVAAAAAEARRLQTEQRQRAEAELAVYLVRAKAEREAREKEQGPRKYGLDRIAER